MPWSLIHGCHALLERWFPLAFASSLPRSLRGNGIRSIGPYRFFLLSRFFHNLGISTFTIFQLNSEVEMKTETIIWILKNNWQIYMINTFSKLIIFALIEPKIGAHTPNRLGWAIGFQVSFIIKREQHELTQTRKPSRAASLGVIKLIFDNEYIIEVKLITRLGVSI